MQVHLDPNGIIQRVDVTLDEPNAQVQLRFTVTDYNTVPATTRIFTKTQSTAGTPVEDALTSLQGDWDTLYP